MVKLTFTLSLSLLCHRRYKCLQNGIFNKIALLQGNYGFISLKKASELVSLLAVLLLFFLLLVQ